MNKQNGFALVSIIALVTVAILAIGGGTYYIKTKKAAPVAEQSGDTQEVAQQPVASVNLPALVTLTPAGTPAVATKTQQSSSDCGTIEAKTIEFGKPIEGANKIAMSCINKAIVACSPAFIKIIGTGTSIIRVTKKEGTTCAIAQETITSAKTPSKNGFEYYTTCKFPISTFIKPLQQSLLKAGGDDLLWMGLNFIKDNNNARAGSDGWYLNEAMGIGNIGIIKYKCK